MIGYKFPHNGAVVVATAPADNDSMIVLCKLVHGGGWAGARQRTEWVTGRVYLRQLPTPEEWDAGTYHETVEGAVESWATRTGLLAYGGDTEKEKTIRYLSAFIRTSDARLEETVQTIVHKGVTVEVMQSEVDDRNVLVQIDTFPGQRVTVVLNDGDLFVGDPEEPRNSFEVIRRAALAFLHSDDSEAISLRDLADALGTPYEDVEAIRVEDAEVRELEQRP